MGRTTDASLPAPSPLPYNPVTFATGKHAEIVSVLRLCPFLAAPALSAFALAGLLIATSTHDSAEAGDRVGVAAAVTPAATSCSPLGAPPTHSRSASRSSITSASTLLVRVWCRCCCSTARPSRSAGLEPRHRQIRLRPEKRQGRAGRELLQGRSQIRRRQAVEGGAGHRGENTGRRADRARRHVPGLDRRS